MIPNGIDLRAGPTCRERENTEPVSAFVGLMSTSETQTQRCPLGAVSPWSSVSSRTSSFSSSAETPRRQSVNSTDGTSIFVTGTVADVAEYLRSASVVVVPIRFGGGTRIKILEALAHRKAVVSTTTGAEGNRSTIRQASFACRLAGGFREGMHAIVERQRASKQAQRRRIQPGPGPLSMEENRGDDRRHRVKWRPTPEYRTVGPG